MFQYVVIYLVVQVHSDFLGPWQKYSCIQLLLQIIQNQFEFLIAHNQSI